MSALSSRESSPQTISAKLWIEKNKSNLVSDYLHWCLTFADLFGHVTIFASQFVCMNLRHWWIWIYFAFSISSEGFRPDLRNNGHGKHWASSGGAKFQIHLYKYKYKYTNTRRTCVYRQPWISDALGRPLKCFLHSSLKITQQQQQQSHLYLKVVFIGRSQVPTVETSASTSRACLTVFLRYEMEKRLRAVYTQAWK